MFKSSFLLVIILAFACLPTSSSAQTRQEKRVAITFDDLPVASTVQTDERWAEIAEKEQFLLTVTENGYGKRTSTYEYRRTNRGGQGIINIITSERNGGVVASFPVKPGEQLMLVTDQAKIIRTTVGDIRITGRNTQGVTIFKVADNEHVVSVAKIDESDEEEIEVEGGEEIEPVDDAIVGESELDKPVDPEQE